METKYTRMHDFPIWDCFMQSRTALTPLSLVPKHYLLLSLMDTFICMCLSKLQTDRETVCVRSYKVKRTNFFIFRSRNVMVFWSTHTAMLSASQVIVVHITVSACHVKAELCFQSARPWLLKQVTNIIYLTATISHLHDSSNKYKFVVNTTGKYERWFGAFDMLFSKLTAFYMFTILFFWQRGT